MHFRTLVLSLLSLSSFALFAQTAKLDQAMVALDRAYIPALGLSGQPSELARATIALAAFEKAWTGFRDGPAAEPGFDSRWKEDLAIIDGDLAEAKKALLVEGKGPEAHEALEGVRMTLLAARQRQSIPYFLDYVTLYHNSMEDILNGKPVKPLKDWSDSERLAFAADLDIGIARWNMVRAKEGLLPEMDLSEKARATYASQWQTIGVLMSDIKAALASGDEKALVAKLVQLKPNFTKTFFLFGDFPQ
ncbi:MAG TPA: hypothetical protein VMV44_09470 [Rectinemataceae bacterium]|nr:hypothetical protein [Rectinemataceae bacterium]